LLDLQLARSESGLGVARKQADERGPPRGHARTRIPDPLLRQMRGPLRGIDEDPHSCEIAKGVVDQWLDIPPGEPAVPATKWGDGDRLELVFDYHALEVFEAERDVGELGSRAPVALGREV